MKISPLSNQMLMPKPRRRSNAGLVLMLLLVLIASLLLLGVSIFTPAKLAIAQERALSLVHGGIAASEEHTFVDACVQVGGVEGPQAVTRTVRKTSFGDGSSISVIFDSSPAPSNSQCSG